MSNIGSLVVSLEANIAKFQSDLGKAAAEAEKRAKEIDKAFAIVKTGLTSIGIGFTVGATFDKIKEKIEGVIKAAAGLQQMAEKTGSAVEALSGLVAVAKLSGTGADDLTSGLQKLAKAMIDAENGGTKTTAAFKAIGISTDELKGKSPADLFLLISNQLAKYKDGAEKLVIAQVLLGKAGANLLPVSKDLALVGEYLVKTTSEQSEEADRLEKNQVRLAASTDAIFKKIGLELIPVFDAFTKALLDTQAANGGLRSEVDKLAKDGSIRAWAEDAILFVGHVIDAFDGVSRVVQIVGKSLGSIAAQVASNFRGDFAGAAEIAKSTGTEIDEILNRTLFSSRLKKQLEENRKPVRVSPELPSPDVRGLGNKNLPKGPVDDPAKKLLEGQIKAQEGLIAAEKTQLANREKYLDFYRSLEYINLRESETKKQELIAVSLANTEAAYDKEVAAIKVFRAQATKLVDQRDADNKLDDIAKKRAAAELEASGKIVDAQNKLLAVKRQFDLATTEETRAQGKANDAAQFSIDLMGKSTLEVQKAIAAKSIQLALDERIYQLKKLDPTVDTSQAIADAAIQTAKAQALITAGFDKQRDAFFGASEAVRKYVEEATNNGAQIENVLTNAFKGAEDALVNFVTTGKLDFKSLANSIISDLARMAIKQQIIAPLAQSLGIDANNKTVGGIGLGGGGSGLGGLFGSLIGAFGGGGGTSDVLGDFIKTKGFADGGSPPLNVPSLIGEHGPELFMPTSAGTIIPNSALRGSGAGDGGTMNVTNNFSFSEAPSRKTQDQVALAAGNAVNRARRNA
jgi:lambda family phage tail tape measure protein